MPVSKESDAGRLFFFAAVFYCVLGCMFYSFVAFAVPLKDQLHFSQSDLDLIAAAGYVGTNLLQFFLSPVMATSKRSWIAVAWLALITGGLGWGLLALALDGGYSGVSRSVGAVATYMFLTATNVSLCYLLVLTVLAAHFPLDFTLWNGILNISFVSGTVWVWPVWVYAYDSQRLGGLFATFTWLCLIVSAVMIIAITRFVLYAEHVAAEDAAEAAAARAAAAAQPIAVVVASGSDSSGSAKRDLSTVTLGDPAATPLNPAAADSAEQPGDAPAADPTAVHSLSAFWAMAKRDGIAADVVGGFALFFALFGVGVTYNSNFPSYFKSISADGNGSADGNTLFLYFMIGQLIGRAGDTVAIALRDRTITRLTKQRKALLAIPSAQSQAEAAAIVVPQPISSLDLTGAAVLAMACGLLVSALSTNVAVATAMFFVIAAAYGSLWVTFAGVMAELFGAASVTVLYGWYAWAPALSPMLFGQITGALYDANADATHNCVGAHCFRAAWFVCAAVLGAGLGVFWVLRVHKRSRDTVNAASASSAANGDASTAASASAPTAAAAANDYTAPLLVA